MDCKPYENLANAIVIQATKDYKSVFSTLKKNRKNETALKNKEQLEKFFLSDWMSILTYVNGTYLINKIKEEENFYE